jgi:hypothetical protein
MAGGQEVLKMDEIPILVKSEEHEGLDDAFKSLYKPSEKHSGWMQLKAKAVQIPREDNPSLSHHYAAEDIAGLKWALSQEKESLRSLKAKQAEFDGVDLASLKKIESEYQRLKKEGGGNKNLDEALKSAKEELQSAHSEEISKRDERESKLMDQIKKLMIVDKATAAILKHKGNVKLLLPHIVEQMTVVEEDGNFETRIKNPDGKGHRISMESGADHTYMQPDELVGGLKDVDGFSVAFQGSGASGSGSSGSDGVGGSNSGAIRLSKSDMLDVKKYRAARIESEKTGRPIEMIE